MYKTLRTKRCHVLPLHLLSSMDNFSLVSSVCPKEGKLSTIFDRRAAGWTYGHMATKISWMDIARSEVAREIGSS